MRLHHPLALLICVGCQFQTEGVSDGEMPETLGDSQTSGGVSTGVGDPATSGEMSDTQASSTSSTDSETPPTTGSATATPTTDAAASSSSSGEPIVDDWNEFDPIFITTSGVALTESVDDAPVLVILTPEDIDYDLVQESGADLRFLDPRTNQKVPHEIESWTPGGTSYVWVLVPNLPPDSAKMLWMSYDNPAAPDQQDAAGVWADEFISVWHMNGKCEGPPPHLVDATGSGRDATCNGLVDANIAGGLVADAVVFDTPGQSVELPHMGALQFQTDFTLEAWVAIDDNVLASGDENRFAIRKDGSYSLLATHTGGGGQGPRFEVEFDNRVDVNQSEPDPGWHYLVGTATEDGEVCLYVDGAQVQCKGAGAEFALEANPLEIGRDLLGVVDEVRVSSVARSPDWIQLQYMASRGLLTTFGG